MMRKLHTVTALASFCAVALLLPNQGLSQQPTLQQILDSLYLQGQIPNEINVETDETGIESFEVAPGQECQAIVLDEQADMFPGMVQFGLYVGVPPTFPPPEMLKKIIEFGAGPGDTKTFSVDTEEPFGFYIAEPDYSPFFYWYTVAEHNVDVPPRDHALVFETGEPNEYIIAFEDEHDLGNGDYQDLVVWVIGPTAAGEEPITVQIDICPDSDANPVNPTTGPPVIPVAIFGSADFDPVTQIDPYTLALDGNSPGDPVGIADAWQVVDVNGDGLDDLLVQFLKDGIVYGDVEGIVTGKTYDGIPVIGSDSIKTVGRKPGVGPKSPKTKNHK